MLEITIVLLIIGVLSGAAIYYGSEKVTTTEISQSRERLEAITESIKHFTRRYGRLPCPSPITLAETDANFGWEASDCNDTTPPAGITRVEYPAASGKYIRIGGVPFRSLMLSNSFAADEWSGRYRYAVAEELITAIDSSKDGTLRILDNAGGVITDAAAIAVLSHGESLKGAVLSSLSPPAIRDACDSAAKDGENCDNDGIFTDALYNNGAVAANFFDDLVLWKTRAMLLGTVS